MQNDLMRSRGFLTIPVAILIAGVIIAGAIIYAVGRNAVPPVAQVDDSFDVGNPEKMNPIDEKNDHVLGNAKAPVVVVEYSDFECPFCKRYHETMHRVMQEYGNKVAWVYRHFPLDAIHSQARKEAEATECVAALGGNGAFWKFADKIFEITPSNNGLDLVQLPKLAKEAGVSEAEFNKCLESGQYAKAVEDDYQNGVATGVQGTPHSIVVAASGKKLTINGAQPLSEVKKILDVLLEQ